jgi:hypothetical protein
MGALKVARAPAREPTVWLPTRPVPLRGVCQVLAEIQVEMIVRPLSIHHGST